MEKSKNMTNQKTQFCLVPEFTFLTGLTYKLACQLLELACKGKLGRRYIFNIKSSSCDAGWSLVGLLRSESKRFIAHPEDYCINVEPKEEK